MAGTVGSLNAKYDDAAIIVTSDTCAKDSSLDKSGVHVVDQLRELRLFTSVKRYIIPDNREVITALVKSLSIKCNLIITVGGTGLCPRDVTPEATSCLYDKSCSGISTALLIESLSHSQHAALSRLTAGVSGQCLIINFPGKLKACQQCFAKIGTILPHALEQVVYDESAYKNTHFKQDLEHKQITQDSHPEKHEAKQLKRNLDSPSKGSCARKQVCHGTKSPGPSSILELESSKSKSRVESIYPLVNVEDAMEILLRQSEFLCKALEAETRPPIDEYDLGRILLEDVKSRVTLPPFQVSTMDGYVLNIPRRFKNFIASIGSVCALLVSNIYEFKSFQRSAEHSSTFFCYQVNTGDQVPDQDYIVIPFEKTGPKTVKNTVPIHEIPVGCHYIRQPGSDLDTSYILPKGSLIGPVEFSLLSVMRPKAFKTMGKPIIGILATGDELISAKSQHQLLDKVIDANSPMLLSLFKLRNYQVHAFGIVKDDLEEIVRQIGSVIESCNILLITGGASMGTKDYVKAAILRLGFSIEFGRVNMKPGKPVAFAFNNSGTKTRFIFSLPGNPVSAYVASLVLVLPFINMAFNRAMEKGPSEYHHHIGPLIDVRISKILDGSDESNYKLDGRMEFIRAKLISQNPDCSLVSVSIKQQSSRLISLQNFDCLIIIFPEEKQEYLNTERIYKAIRLS